MTSIPEWEAYSRLQAKLASTSKLNNETASIEAAMDKILASANTLTSDEVARAKNTAARRERHRNSLRTQYLFNVASHGTPIPDIEMRSFCASVTSTVAPKDLKLFSAIAEGHSQNDVAQLFGATPGAIGARICRARYVARQKLTPPLLEELRHLLAA
jgi:hypothetical protein